jgi:uncharacterized Zn ribbon protein
MKSKGTDVIRGKISIVGSLESQYPELIKEWNYEKNDKTPNEYTPNSRYKVWWICSECKNEWQAQIKSRNNGCGCPECAKKYRKKPSCMKPRDNYVSYEKSLAYLFPDISKEWNTNKNILNPNQVGVSSKLKAWWTCSKCGYIYERQIRNRTQRNNGCPKC